MKKIRTLLIKADTRISVPEIPLFRGAVINLLDGACSLYHNHGAGDGVLYRYPLIQYKRINQRGAILGIEQGTEVLGEFLSKSGSVLAIGEREAEYGIVDISARQCLIQVWDEQFEYQIRKWLPFNAENYRAYSAADGLSDRIHLLESILTGNLLSFAKGVGETISSTIVCTITMLGGPVLYTYKGVRMMGFDAVFKTNIFLPDYIGLGKGVSLGFGTIKQKRHEQ